MLKSGRSALEKDTITLIAKRFERLYPTKDEAWRNAASLVDDAIMTLRSGGLDPFNASLGDEYASDERYVAARIKAGLTAEEIRAYWNRPLMVIFCQERLRKLHKISHLSIADKQGIDLKSESDYIARTFPRYGVPEEWDPMEHASVGFSEVDAELYPEFDQRIDVFIQAAGEASFVRMMEQSSSLNAAFRALIAEHTH